MKRWYCPNCETQYMFPDDFKGPHCSACSDDDVPMLPMDDEAADGFDEEEWRAMEEAQALQPAVTREEREAMTPSEQAFYPEFLNDEGED